MSITMRVAFFVVIILLHIFIYFMLFKNISTSPAIKHFGKFLVIANFVCIIIFFRLYHANINATLYTMLSSSIGIFWISVNVSLAVLVINTFVRFGFGYITLFAWQGRILLLAWAVIIALVILSFYINAKAPSVIEQDVEIKGLGQDLDVVLVTDLHIGVLMNKQKLSKIVTQINNLHPDIIMLGGDIVDNYYENVKESVKELQNLRARYGVFYAIGNHEYYYDTQNILRGLSDIGINVLVNKSVTLENARLNIAGIADMVGLRFKRLKGLQPNLAKTLESTNENYPTILLSHQPKVLNILGDFENLRDRDSTDFANNSGGGGDFKDSEKREFSGLSSHFVSDSKRKSGAKRIDLVLSGHTHGGQIFPFQLLVLIEQPFLSGLHRFNYADFGVKDSMVKKDSITGDSIAKDPTIKDLGHGDNLESKDSSDDYILRYSEDSEDSKGFFSKDSSKNSGSFLSRDSQIYVSCGAGWWGMPMRLFSPREISLLHLKKSRF